MNAPIAPKSLYTSSGCALRRARGGNKYTLRQDYHWLTVDLFNS